MRSERRRSVHANDTVLPSSEPAPGESIAAVIQATLVPIVSPLVHEIAESRRVIERLAGEVAELREQRGRLAADLEAKAEALEWTQQQLDIARAQISILAGRTAEGDVNAPMEQLTSISLRQDRNVSG
jgi:hypothetical protein